jgi:cyanophycin synthetase
MIPAPGQVVYLKSMANLSTGGSAIDVTDFVHADLRFYCERAAGVCGLDVCGVDLIAEDISRGLDQSHGIVELNASPGFRMHTHPSKGQPRDVGAAVIDHLYPPGTSARIPILAVTGTNGKTTVTRLAGFIMGEAGHRVGLTTSDGVYIGEKKILSGDTSGPISAQAVLNDPLVEVAVLETARGGIVKRGLGFDQCDAAVLTNITEDHIGQDGIENVQDILRIKSVVTEAVRPGGTVVINADDEVLVGYAKDRLSARPASEVTMFSMKRRCFFLREHIARGGRAFFYDDGWIFKVVDQHESRLIRAADIPLTLGGGARFQIANVMASVALVSSQNVSDDVICRALRHFRGMDHNKGRVNIYRKGSGYVILDYGHNPAAFAAMAEMAAQWHGRRTAIVGVPGDRDDDVEKLAARIVARGFDRIILRDDVNRRGRAPGEIPGIFRQVIFNLEPRRECQIILDEMEAIETALSQMQDDEMIFAFFDERDKLTRVLADFNACAVDTIDWKPIGPSRESGARFVMGDGGAAHVPAPLYKQRPSLRSTFAN